MNFSSFFYMVVTMFIILAVGFFLGKKGIIDRTASKNLSKLIIAVGQPALIINSIISKDYSQENLTLSLKSLGLGLTMHIVASVIAFLVCIKIKDLNERKITEFALVFGNIGFLGIPVLGALFPENGAFVATFFVVSFNILLWIIGIGIIARKRDDVKLTVKKIFINKGTIPSLIGFMIFLIPAFFPSFKLPTFAQSSISYIASLCTPISMIIIGVLLSSISLKKLFCSAKVYYLCAFKLIIIPLIFCISLKLLGVPDFWVLFITACSAMPSASTTSMFAELYDIAPEYSAQCVGTTTLISLATMPLLILIAQQILRINFNIFQLF